MTDLLFSPLKCGNMELQTRIVMAPLTRFRNDDDGSPIADLAPLHYAQRSVYPGTLLIAEATDISAISGTYRNAPGVYTEKQIAAWKKVTDAVHAKNSYIFVQLWAIGRVNPGKIVKEIVGASAIKSEEGFAVPRPLEIDEIVQFEDAFADAAKHAIEAGFDGIEIHGAHGYLVDQFLQDVSNTRTDIYGGSIENRARFMFNILQKTTAAIGPERVAIRLSPFAEAQGMKMADPYPTFSYVVSRLQQEHPDLAYVHMVEPRVSGVVARSVQAGETTDDYRKLWKGVWVAAGGFTPENAAAYITKFPDNTLIAFGRHFISNPDLVLRVKEGIPFRPYDRSKFYTNKRPEGYIDYEYAPQFKSKF
ncbi:uncharacterized protein V1516DRAFT_623852 [Lipomyces oligophaga]|uniref:uncharacterized protein n=1 Tax=Lipomyces oligophaga TaxID=45792 RepID=UPI0034CD4F4C